VVVALVVRESAENLYDTTSRPKLVVGLQRIVGYLSTRFLDDSVSYIWRVVFADSSEQVGILALIVVVYLDVGVIDPI
jgi:hypothetical protein